MWLCSWCGQGEGGGDGRELLAGGADFGDMAEEGEEEDEGEEEQRAWRRGRGNNGSTRDVQRHAARHLHGDAAGGMAGRGAGPRVGKSRGKREEDGEGTEREEIGYWLAHRLSFCGYWELTLAEVRGGRGEH